jgi:glycosyltransferase involved in cell wall biosynthesis
MGKKMIETLDKEKEVVVKAGQNGNIEVSVVMPCLNEADTLETCIKKIQTAFKESGIVGEIIVADNGSTDESKEIALRNGVRVVEIMEKGYGNALMGGIEAAKGKFVIMGDADDSYDFFEVPKFVSKLREGFDLVQGCRMPSGGGKIMPNAMPFLHRWWGNPMFSGLVRLWFNAPINDVNCGLRGFTKEHYDNLDLQCTGMEFATEMIIKSSLYNVKIAEIPITLHQDGRISHPPHLRTFRDGWRTLRFYLMYSPRWLFLVPGTLLILFGLLCFAMGLSGFSIGNPFPGVDKITFGIHTVVFGSLAILSGYQSILFSIFTKTFAVMEGLMPEDKRLNKFYEIFNLERGLLLAVISLLIGMGLLFISIYQWWQAGFGLLNYTGTMKFVIPGVTLASLGFQTILAGFFISILGMKRK